MPPPLDPVFDAATALKLLTVKHFHERDLVTENTKIGQVDLRMVLSANFTVHSRILHPIGCKPKWKIRARNDKDLRTVRVSRCAAIVVGTDGRPVVREDEQRNGIRNAIHLDVVMIAFSALGPVAVVHMAEDENGVIKLDRILIRKETLQGGEQVASDIAA